MRTSPRLKKKYETPNDKQHRQVEVQEALRPAHVHERDEEEQRERQHDPGRVEELALVAAGQIGLRPAAR